MIPHPPDAPRHAELLRLPLTAVGRGWGRRGFVRTLVRMAAMREVACIAAHLVEDVVCVITGREAELDAVIEAMTVSRWHSGPQRLGARLEVAPRVLTVSDAEPMLLPHEAGWLENEMDTPHPRVALAMAMLEWAALRDLERRLPGAGPPDPFPMVRGEGEGGLQ